MALYALEPLKPIEKVNFPDDRLYTINALIEELALAERHCRDESYKSCSCLGEKHTYLISGLASESYGFADSPQEKEFMRKLMVRSRKFREDIKNGKIRTQQDFEVLRAWTREMRHRLEQKNWKGEWSRFETPELVEVVTQVHALTGGLAVLEEQQVDRILTELSRKHGVPKPRFRFVEGCNPLRDAWMVGRDLISRDEDGEITRSPLTDLDELVFCRGGASPYAVAHEFCHFKDRVKEGETDEKSATKCALKEVGNEYSETHTQKHLYTLSGQKSNGGNNKMGQFEKLTARIGDSLPLIGGVVVGEYIDASGQIDAAIAPFAGTWTGLAKGILGAAIVGLGLGMKKGAMADVVVGAGLPIAASGFTQQFLGTTPAARARMVGARVAVTPAQLTPYAIPTGLRYGRPTLQVPYIPPRSGILAPSAIPKELAGKFILGSR